MSSEMEQKKKLMNPCNIGLKQLAASYSTLSLSPPGTCKHSNTGMKKTSPFSLINSSPPCSNNQIDAGHNASYHVTVSNARKGRRWIDASEVKSLNGENQSPSSSFHTAHPFANTAGCIQLSSLLENISHLGSPPMTPTNSTLSMTPQSIQFRDEPNKPNKPNQHPLH
jgi:hypothetical protein